MNGFVTKREIMQTPQSLIAKLRENISRVVLGQAEVVRLTVVDTGTGMPPDVLARIQEPFFTTKEPGRGTGLGLTTVYSVVRAAGGAVTVASTPGQGTTFTIDFPAVPPGEDVADVPAPVPAIGGTETVLLVEDDTILRSMYARHLRELGYCVATAPTAEVGLELWRTSVTEPDIVVSDVGLPGMHGPEMVRTLRRACPDLPAVLISGLPVAISSDAGEWSELRKPFTAATLATAIRRQLDTRSLHAAGCEDGR